MSESWRHVLGAAEGAARKVGERVREVLSGERTCSVSMKGEQDPVTDIDLYSESIFLELIKNSFPTHRLLSEEMAATVNPEQWNALLTKGKTWIVDPIDGTTNLSIQNPYCSVSIGILEDGILSCGVIYDPSRDELFSAIRGEGAYLNGKRINPSTVSSIHNSVISLGLPHNFRENWTDSERYIREFAQDCRGVRIFGSAALDIANTACGRLSGFFHRGLKPWDVAGGSLILQEAGGKSFNFLETPGSAFLIDSPSHAFCAPGIYNEFQEKLRKLAEGSL